MSPRILIVAASLVGKPMFRGLTYDLTRDGFELTAGNGFLSRKLAWTRG